MDGQGLAVSGMRGGRWMEVGMWAWAMDGGAGVGCVDSSGHVAGRDEVRERGG